MPFNSLNVSDFPLCHTYMCAGFSRSKSCWEKLTMLVATQHSSVGLHLPTDQIIAWVWISKSLQVQFDTSHSSVGLRVWQRAFNCLCRASAQAEVKG